MFQHHKKRPPFGSPLLSYQDSNLDKQSQNLLCYHYTIAQCGHNFRKIYPVVQGVD